MSARIVLLLIGLVCGSIFALGVLDKYDARWSRIQCAVFAVLCYALALAAWLGLGA